MRTEILLITPKLAANFLERNKSNRRLNENSINFYADQMSRNQWKLTGQGISFDSDNYLLDGQHRLHAIIKSQTSVKMLVVYEVDRDSFTCYDSGKNRNMTDIFSISEIPNASTVSTAIQFYINLKNNRGVNFSSNLARSRKITRYDCLNEYNKDAEFWQECVRVSMRCYKKMRILNLGFTASFVYYSVKEKNKPVEYVVNFLNQLFGFDSDEFNATKLFRDAVVKDALSTKKMSPVHKLGLFKKTWNCYVTKRDVKCLKYDERENEIEIL
jgi:hypothetical protein